MTKYIIPCFILIIIVIAFIKKINVYDSFILGAKEALKLIYMIFPFLLAILMAVELFKASGLSVYLSKLLSPVLSFLGIPSELCELLIVRPLSGNGAVAMLSDIYATYGVDSYISRCASTIIGASETVFYVISIYFASVKIKKTRYALAVSLIATYVGVIFSCLMCRLI